MFIKTIIAEDFSHYKLPSMCIGTIKCGGKCCIEAGIPLSVCHNDGWRTTPPVFKKDRDIINSYLCNPITKAIVFAGLEPFEQFEEIYEFIRCFREDFGCIDPIIIYTGYNKTEILSSILRLKSFKNIIIKYGRYVPDKEKVFDSLLGVELASPNQYAELLR